MKKKDNLNLNDLIPQIQHLVKVFNSNEIKDKLKPTKSNKKPNSKRIDKRL